ncbi:hypothetical protein FLAG1_07746 [Fusarium langsethiae]|uniref:F-box domain-containing protein n=1 Tax=Fusarium langsethiae TaxID=179993 RepID=A0A0M9ETC3_FUSLA|nr:hypothetical protein FLAG1_07746 [Fusarium langsethiae]GKU21906.1 unnamed protein product [Fusarium langsethiae]
MDVFAQLPPELLAAILTDLPDLESLYSIVKASPGVSRFLNSPLGATVLDGLLDSWSSTILKESLTTDGDSRKRHVTTKDLGTTPWVPYILRLIALLRHCTVNDQPADDLTSFILKFIMPSKEIEGVPQIRAIPSHHVPNIRLEDLGVKQAFLTREILFLIRKLLVLASECFDFFLERIKSTRPHHLAEKPSFLDQRPLWGHLIGSQPWGQPYEINAGDEASWYEIQRLIIGFCMLQLRYELSNAVYEGRLDWPADDVKKIRSMGTSDPCVPILENSNIQLIWEPMWAAAIYVASLKGASNDSSSSCVGDTNVERNKLRVFFDTGFQPLEEEYLQLPRPKREDPSLEWPKVVVRHHEALYFGESLYLNYEIVLFGSKGSRWAADILCPPLGRRMTEGLLFRPLRRLGFGIWDDKRMVQMEMIDDPSAEPYIPRRFSLWSRLSIHTRMD